MGALGSVELPLRVAVVGSGPSGFYAAEALLKSGLKTRVDVFDRLPCPYGLVRLGVAPDHQGLKGAIRAYEKTAALEGFSFVGNVGVGTDVSVEELREFYDAIIFANGAQTDRRLNIPGEDLPGSHTATEFVAWYNGHPDYADHAFDLTQESVAVIGQGNVAVDVCRILAKTVDELRHTDIAQHALDAFAGSHIKDIYMIGRRGPAQAKFTHKEIKELGELAACDPVVTAQDLVLDPLSQAEFDAAKPTSDLRKNVELLGEFSRRAPREAARKLHFVFLRGPFAIEGANEVSAVQLEANRLTGTPGNLSARGTGETERLACGLIFRSVGYGGVAMPGVPFDPKTGVIPNVKGRIVQDGRPVPGFYVTGWIKRGPSGLIGTNRPDSVETVGGLLEDVGAMKPAPNRDSRILIGRLAERGVRPVTFADWTKIDAVEVGRGAKSGKPREKIVQVAEMLDIAGPKLRPTDTEGTR